MSTSWPPQCFVEELNMSFNSSLPSSYQRVALEDHSIFQHEHFLKNIHNGTITLNNPTTEDSYFWWKAILVILDIFGLTFSGLGIDMIWHGVEVNHAVYFVILQDVCLAFITTLVSQIFSWFFWNNDLSWFRFYGFLALLPIMFHNWAWASVAQLRCLNITNNDQWLELDQENVRKRTSWMTWVAFTGNILASLTPLAFYFQFEMPENNYRAVVIFTFSAMSVSFLFAFTYYLRIYIFARREAAEFEAALAEAQASVQANSHVPSENGTSFNGVAASFNNIFDDSEDDDLLDVSESPSAKQASAVFNALKTMLFIGGAMIASAVILVSYDEQTWKYAILSTMLCLIRNPGIIMVCIFNFGPIRNTVTLYLENIPEHISCSMCPFLERFFPMCKSKDDQRNIVEAAREDLERAISPENSKDSKPNIVGKRDSAVSPSDSSNSSFDELPVVQC